jgi:hypothetical protein
MASSTLSLPGMVIPEVLKKPDDYIDITFKLRDCPFIEFHRDMDKGRTTVYDLMAIACEHHGETIEPDKVRIFVKVSDKEYRPLPDFTKKLTEVECADVFYYDFDPVKGSLLIIPPDK